MTSTRSDDLIRQPVWIRAVNRLLSLRPVDLSADALRRRAVRATGLDDFGHDPGWDRRLELVAQNLDNNDNLNALGRWCAAFFYQFKLTNKLHVVELLKRQPDILERSLLPPIFIIGWYRTGTTLLHNLLAADPGHRAFRAWELMTPYPTSRHGWLDRRLRRLRAHATFASGRFLMPDYKVAHPLKIDWPEEDFFLLENDLVGPTLIFLYRCADYANKLIDWDVEPAYLSMRAQVQLLMGSSPGRTFVGKAPIHTWNVAALHRAFPDARFVFTHRDPVTAIASNCSFVAMTSRAVSRRAQLPSIGRFWLDYNRTGMARAWDARRGIPESRQIDVPLSALAGDPVATVQRIYRHFGMPLGPAASAALDLAVAQRRGRPKEGKVHHYALDAFGLTPTGIESVLDSYLPRYRQIEHDWADALAP